MKIDNKQAATYLRSLADMVEAMPEDDPRAKMIKEMAIEASANAAARVAKNFATKVLRNIAARSSTVDTDAK